MAQPPSFSGYLVTHPVSGTWASSERTLDLATEAHQHGNSSTPSTGMAHAHRPTTLPHPGPQLSTRDQYSPASTPYRRSSEHAARSPSFPGTPYRRHPLSPTSGSLGSFTPQTASMDPGQYPAKSQGSIPPLGPLTMLGELQYTDGAQGTSVKAEIHGLIDKGFFLSDGEWTCYRRNYFSCVCSYTLSPYYNTPIRFTPSNTNQPLNVHGFAMCISAVVADTDSHSIELVQHTPKRDKGPVAKPEKVRLSPKVSQPGHHSMLYGHNNDPARGIYADGFGGPQAGPNTYQTEHTFERIQFKQATANNGKRRAAQQYYHLLVELWADVGPPGPDQFVKVAYKKSAKMIVRGRSPGHYQSERRGSTSSGPGGATGSMSSYSGAPAMGSDYGSGGAVLGSSYPAAYDTRGTSGPYSSRHHHSEMAPDSIIPPEESKAIDTTKGYQYYPHTIYEGHQDARPGGIDMFTHQRGGEDEAMVSHMAASAYESTPKIKSEYEATGLPSLFHTGPLAASRRCGQFEGKSRSDGYYPSSLLQSSVNLTNA